MTILLFILLLKCAAPPALAKYTKVQSAKIRQFQLKFVLNKSLYTARYCLNYILCGYFSSIN